MALLEKIRGGKFGVFATGLVALGLLSFIVSPQDLISRFQNSSSKVDVGNIDGKRISYVDFQSDVQNMSTINELMGGAQGSEAQAQARDAAWQNLIYRDLFVKKAQAAGINVGQAEIVDLTTGNNLSPLVYQNPVFVDQNGMFSKEQLTSFLQSLNLDETGRLRLYWDYLQTSIANQKYSEKYNALFTQASLANALQIRKEIEQNNNTSDVEFVMVPFGYQTDSTITVSDSEIKSYYNSHKQMFKQTANRDMEYVVFEVVPSEKDINDTKSAVADLYDEFSSTENMKNFLVKNSDRTLSDYWYKKGELNTVNASIDEFVWSGTGNVSDIVTSGSTFLVARVMDTQMIPDSAYVKHILLQGEATAKADSLLAAVKGGASISNLAAEFSADQGSMTDGELGTIGWMTQNYMIAGFESVLQAKVNDPFILDTQYGKHIVVVTKKSAPVEKKQVAIFAKETLPSTDTFNKYYAQANTFATAAAGGYANYKKAVEEQGVYSHPMNGMMESSDRLGAIGNTKEVTRWVFDNKAGKVSDIITVDQNYFFVATVKAIHKEGYATVAEAAPAIRSTLELLKEGEKVGADVKSKIAGLSSLEEIAEKLNTSVNSQSGVAFSSLNSQGLDPAFIGAISVAPEGKVVGPVVGQIGVYVFKVTGRDTGAYYTEDDAKSRDAQYASYNSQMIIPVMMNDADVKDNRARFY